jgi:hypothetical protein
LENTGNEEQKCGQAKEVLPMRVSLRKLRLTAPQFSALATPRKIVLANFRSMLEGVQSLNIDFKKNKNV